MSTAAAAAATALRVSFHFRCCRSRTQTKRNTKIDFAALLFFCTNPIKMLFHFSLRHPLAKEMRRMEGKQIALRHSSEGWKWMNHTLKNFFSSLLPVSVSHFSRREFYEKSSRIQPRLVSVRLRKRWINKSTDRREFCPLEANVWAYNFSSRFFERDTRKSK